MRRRTKLTKCDSTCTRVIYSALNRFPHTEFYPTWRAINILRKKMGENINCNNHMAPGPCGSASGDHRSGGRGQRPETPIGCSRWSPVPRPATAVSPPCAVGNVADGYEEGQKIAERARTVLRLGGVVGCGYKMFSLIRGDESFSWDGDRELSDIFNRVN